MADQPAGMALTAPPTTEERIKGFSLYAPWLQQDPITYWKEIQEVGPVLRSEQHGGFWILTRHEDIAWAARNPEIFASREMLIPYRSTFAADEREIPLGLDGEVHRKWRQAIVDTFKPATVNHFTPAIRQAATELADNLAGRDGCEFIRDFAVALPGEAFLIDYGIGRDRLPELLAFKDWFVREALPNARSDEEVIAAAEPLRDFFAEVIEQRRRDDDPDARDVISHLLRATYDGRPLTMAEMTNTSLVTMMASLDTTTSALGLSWAWLARNPETRRAVLADPSKTPALIEELLRHEPVLSTARVVTRDVQLHGVTLHEGDMVLLSWGMSGLDPDVFASPDEVDLARAPGNQLAFGVGPHRCLGMHLARRILSIAFEVWHARIPEYHLDPANPPVSHYSAVRGLSRLDLVFD
ncbi:Cytochrome P450 family protein [Frankia canadensis]|uniref:Cytochrome P450 family protein n=1 Tax=Frankia canadensis TaxID=1836972 RepID=A0A2I2KI33_9ACTN|nr:cytochrome P450 [Frankia canadensis]SNQ45328.1 Cytochrome P450 family protein [Frankia canadensis]SOU52618.1 Cytochrome P450 family protein [Frankia canadensis]